MPLHEKLASAAVDMTAAERATYKILLSMAAGGLASSGKLPTGTLEEKAFATAISSIAALEPHSRSIPANGILYRGRPEFMTDDLLLEMQSESSSLRGSAFRFDSHYVVSGATLAKHIGASEQLIGLVERYAGPVIPTAKANYLYYDSEGLGIDPHIDNEDFSLNTILMLEHLHPGIGDNDASALVLYPPNHEPVRIHLQPGELIVIYADSTTHARERMVKGETLRIAAFGFHPIS